MREKAVGILSSRWQPGVDDERERKGEGKEKKIHQILALSDVTLFSPLHDVILYV